MDNASLIEKISIPISKKQAITLAEQSLNSIDKLLELSLHINYEVAFRAAWVLELTCSAHPHKLNERLPEFTDVYLVLKNPSCQRHFTKILMDLTHRHRQAGIFTKADLEAIVEVTFELMINAETPVAVRVNCMDILYDLTDEFDWIAEELVAQIEFQLRNGSAALQSRGKKVLRKLTGRRKNSNSY